MSEPIPIVHVGCGGISGAWLRDIRNNPAVRLVGVVDLDPDRRAHAAAGEEIHQGADVAEAIAATGAVMVTNATAPAAHHVTCAAALAAGAHVLCEKPLTEDLSLAEDLIARANAVGRHLAVCHNRRVCDDIVTVRNLVDDGAIGAVLGLQCGFRRATGTKPNYRADTQHTLLWDMGIHHLDQARYLAGAPGQRVVADDWRPADCSWRQGPVADVQVRFTNGVRFAYRGWYGGVAIESELTDYQGRWLIHGERGVIHWHGNDIRVVTEDGERTVTPTERCGGSAGGRGWLVADMAAAIGEGREPAVLASDHLHSLRLVAAAITSSQEDRIVTLQTQHEEVPA